MIRAFYNSGKDYFASMEFLWEGIFALITSVIITVMGAVLLQVNKLQDKWRVNLEQALVEKHSAGGTFKDRCKQWLQQYFMFVLLFVTVLCEGLEAVIFIGGVIMGFPASDFLLPVITGILAGALVGYIIYQ